MAVLDKCFSVMAAVEALLRTACPGADVRFDPSKAFSIGAGGAVAAFGGDAEEQPDSPLTTALLHHGLPVYVVGAGSGAAGRAATRALVAQIEAAVAADRTLGGLVDHLWIAPEFSGVSAAEALGADAAEWFPLTLMAEYSVSR